MAFIDSAGTVTASAGLGGAPTGGGTPGQFSASAMPGRGQTGAAGPGAGASIKGWVIGFYAIITIVLVGTGLLFNKHAA